MHGQIGKIGQEFRVVRRPSGLGSLDVRRSSDGAIDRKYYMELAHSIQLRTARVTFRRGWRAMVRAVRAVGEWIDAGCRPL